MNDSKQHPPIPLALVIFALLVPAAGAWAQEAQRAAIHISYVSASTIYIDAGRGAGLAVGDQLEVRREGEVIATLEVAWIAEHSASCTLQTELRGVKPGDLIVARAQDGAASAPLPAPQAVETSADPTWPKVAEPPRRGPDTTGLRNTLRERMSGTVSFRFQSFRDNKSGRGFDESTGRVSLRLREIGGRPLQLRARLRTRDIRRDDVSERADRLYELSLLYDPPDGRFSFQAGRLGASPFLSLGYLDGVLGAYRFTNTLSAGLFVGSRPDLEELGFASAGEKYGAFLRFAKEPTDSPFRAEAVIAGIGEYVGGTVNREYVSIESRVGNRKWSFSQLAEIDLNNDWRKDLAEGAQQISNLSVAVSYRPSDRMRASLSYDRRQRFRTLETRPIPEELFDDQLRQGLRLGLQFGRPRGWNASTTFGYRSRDQGETTLSFAGSVYNAGLGNGRFMVGADVSGFNTSARPGLNGGTDGLLVTLRARRAFRRGHDVGLTLGFSSTTVDNFGLPQKRENQWARLSSTVRLPRSLFLRVELEYNVGDDLEGQRLIVELGRRF